MKHSKKILVVALVVLSLFAVALPAMAEYVRYNTAGVFLRSAMDSSTWYGRSQNGVLCEYIQTGFGANNVEWYKVTVKERCVFTDANGNQDPDLNGKTGWSMAAYFSVA